MTIEPTSEDFKVAQELAEEYCQQVRYLSQFEKMDMTRVLLKALLRGRDIERVGQAYD